MYLQRISTEQLRDEFQAGEKSEVVKERVTKVREIQYQRQGCLNSELSVKQLDKICELPSESLALLEKASQRLHLSARAYHRILKLARTIADISNAEDIQKSHVAEAIGYRALDRTTV